MIDVIINYIKGVTFKDSFRLTVFNKEERRHTNQVNKFQSCRGVLRRRKIFTFLICSQDLHMCTSSYLFYTNFGKFSIGFPAYQISVGICFA